MKRAKTNLDDLTPVQSLTAAMIAVALEDSGCRNPQRAAAARFWLLYGDGATFAELAGVDHRVKRELDELPALAGGNTAWALAALARGGEW